MNVNLVEMEIATGVRLKLTTMKSISVAIGAFVLHLVHHWTRILHLNKQKQKQHFQMIQLHGREMFVHLNVNAYNTQNANGVLNSWTNWKTQETPKMENYSILWITKSDQKYAAFKIKLFAAVVQNKLLQVNWN
jgi:hypothetical protein